jgi:uncharacterized protein YggE
MTPDRLLLPFVAFTLIGSTGAARAQPPTPSDRPLQPPSVQVTAEATVSAAPDQATVEIGVTTQSTTAHEATQQNATAVDRVLAALRRAGAADANLHTLRYSVQPVYRRPEGDTPQVEAYTVTNLVRVTIDDVSRVAGFVDAATAAGANQIRQLRFEVADPEALQAKALRAAAAKAWSQARALAAGLDVQIVRMLSAREGTAPVQPFRDMLSARATRATPIEPGTIDVSATVTLTVEIESRRR